ncbi:peptidylprolyl isomerase [archaeon]|jgi:FKBP-type peptidyl-prolyl cis-trans isomerase 2|nr:peptidylprolyl isomerase [archaeon]MBT3451540.1 peptidylprolyl isomerase [archaeon]MBT6869399.1 peptidylprolyl isomerase [archaeon]MBT7192562.1 peptidylprolyl isomerase [archaeon]MBT7380638.1 peptidylprolyl isomerase [archaeon]
MTETIKEKDFIELEFTGRLAQDNSVFDTNNEKVAKENNLFNPKVPYIPVIICVGEKQVLPGLDKELVGKEITKDYKTEFSAEEGFGKKDVKKVQLVPLSTFKENELQPYPGLQVDFDGKMGTVMRVSGGRVMVNFNHPLAGRSLVYEFKIIKKVTDLKIQLESYIVKAMQLPKEMIKVDVKDEIGIVEIPFELPEQFTKPAIKKILELIKLKKIEFKKKEIDMTKQVDQNSQPRV